LLPTPETGASLLGEKRGKSHVHCSTKGSFQQIQKRWLFPETNKNCKPKAKTNFGKITMPRAGKG